MHNFEENENIFKNGSGVVVQGSGFPNEILGWREELRVKARRKSISYRRMGHACTVSSTLSGLLLPVGYDNLYYMYELRTHIVVDPEIRFGKPCIKGTRITVGDILQWLSGGMTEQEITADYPELQGIHIRAALAFAAERDAMTKVVAHETVA